MDIVGENDIFYDKTTFNLLKNLSEIVLIYISLMAFDIESEAEIWFFTFFRGAYIRGT